MRLVWLQGKEPNKTGSPSFFVQEVRDIAECYIIVAAAQRPICPSMREARAKRFLSDTYDKGEDK